MKDMIFEKLIILAKAQERITAVMDKLDHLDNSQMIMEKNAYGSINVSDKVLNMSIEGKYLTEQAEKYYKNNSDSITPLLEEIQSLFQNILEFSKTNSDLSHKIEEETACQKVMKEEIKKSLTIVGDSIDSAVASVEFILAEL